MSQRWRTSLDRAAAFELDVVIRDGVTREKAFSRLFSILGSVMRHSRSISVRALDAGRDFQNSYLSSVFDTELPLAETLILEARSSGPTNDAHIVIPDMLPTYYTRFFPKCPKLRSIVFGNFPLNSYGTPRTAAPNLQHIQLWSDETVADTELAGALAMYPGVPTFRIHSTQAPHNRSWPGPPATQAFANLRSLLIELTDGLAVDFGEQLSFPNLVRLKVGSMDGGYSATMRDALAGLLTRSCLNITRLWLVSIHIDDPLSSACRSLPNLRTLRLGSLAVHDNVLFAEPDSAATFPALRRLFLEDCECADDFTGQTLLDFARTRYNKAAQATEDVGTSGLPALKRIGVSWDNDSLSETHPEILVDDWDAQFAEAVGASDFNDSSDEEDVEREFMRWDLWPRWVSTYGRFPE
ncbi:hypothetical protein AURDEDRAFT_167425 [Auricularia subglabra TFB-10046 SS5]|nr:hypothetical protein AURDEDRAFT_167425 [Auricularia subglabra TFB-10046 SS5]